MLSLVLSFILYGHSLNAPQTVGLLLAVAAMVGNFYGKVCYTVSFLSLCIMFAVPFYTNCFLVFIVYIWTVQLQCYDIKCFINILPYITITIMSL